MLTFENILLENRPSIIFESVVGSQAYGTSLPESDEDIKGIFAVSAGEYLNLESPPSQLSDEKGDKVYYSIRRFLELAATANPNIIELLFMPPDCIRYKSPSFTLLEERRDMFLTKAVFESHIGYAEAQIKKALGQNKWVNNPQPEERPKLEEFCWYLSIEVTDKNDFVIASFSFMPSFLCISSA